jgi:hypothetical protein
VECTLPDVYVRVHRHVRYNRRRWVLYGQEHCANSGTHTVEAAPAGTEAVPTIAWLHTCWMAGRLHPLGAVGGNAVRRQLKSSALELSKRDTGRTLYILDEPPACTLPTMICC